MVNIENWGPRPFLSTDENQLAGGGKFEEIRELDSTEPLSDNDLGQLIRGISTTQVALAVVFLAKHPEGLLAHPDGISGDQFYNGFANMLGLSEEEAPQVLGTLATVTDFLKTAAKGNIITATESRRGHNAVYGLNPSFRSLAPEFSEAVLAYNLTHETSFDIFFVKEKTQRLKDTDMPLRWQIINYLYYMVEGSCEVATMAEDLGTETYLIRKNIQALEDSGVEYVSRPKTQARTFFTVRNATDDLPQKPYALQGEANQTREDIFNILKDLKRKNINGEYTLHDLYHQLVIINKDKYLKEGSALNIFLYIVQYLIY